MSRLNTPTRSFALRKSVTSTLAALCLLTLVIHPVHASEDNTTEVPGLIGKSEADALTLLSERELEAEIVHVNDDVAAPGTVIGQDPKSGSEILRGSKVVLRVIEHAGAPDGGAPVPGGEDQFPDPELPGDEGDLAMAVMPDLLGRSMADAELALVELGFTPRFFLVSAADRTPNTVIAQDQAPNTELPLGTEVRIEIAKPIEIPTQARVPYVRGLSEAAAASHLEAFGFGVSIVRKISNWPKGRVFSQSPASGSIVGYGSDVTIIVAVKPPSMAKSKVPNLSGMKPNEARLALLARGLLYKKRKALGPNRDIKRIFKQSRAPGSLVNPGTRITFYLPYVAKMPNVIGLKKITAKQKVQAASLKPVLSGPAPSPMFTTQVISQLPTAGTYLAKGSNVKVVYKNKPLILQLKKPVPNVIGKSTSKAKNIMIAAGFKTKFFGPANGVGVKVVKTQSPAPGTMLAVGKTVKMTYKFKMIILPLTKKVPNVIGLSTTKAKNKLVAAGFKTQFFGPANGVGVKVVKTQSPAPGTMLKIGKTVKMTYKFKLVLIPGQLIKVKVPNVKGMTVAAAKQALLAKGLKWQLLGFGGFKIKKQFTAAGTKVLKGTKIKILRGV